MSDNSKPYGLDDATYQAAGGYDGLVSLVERFYAAMDSLPEAKIIRAMHDADLTVSKDKLVCFLSGWMGGPMLYTERYGRINIPMAHSYLDVDEAAREAWLTCMEVALNELGYPEDFKAYLLTQLSFPAERIRQASQLRQLQQQ